MNFKISLVCLLGLVYFEINAQDSLFLNRYRLDFENLSDEQMQDEMRVISASRTARSVKELPVTVYVITRAEILANGYTTLADVLKSLPGIKVQQPATGDEGEKFRMRGLAGNYYTKILVNNVAVLPSVLNGMPISAQLPIRQAERIEIIYGAASAIYGSDAAAGVINIVTKMPESLSYAQADAFLGTNGYNYSNFSVGGKTGKNKNILQYAIYGNRMQFTDMNLKSDMDTITDPYAILTQMFSNVTNNGTQLDTAKMYEFFGGEKRFNDLYNTWLKSDFKIKYAQQSEAIGTTFKYRNWSGSFDYMHRSNENTLNALALMASGQGESSKVGESIGRMSLNYSLNKKKWASVSSLSYLRMRSDKPELLANSVAGGGSGNYLASDDLIFDQLVIFNHSENLEVVAGMQYKLSGNFILSRDFSGYFDDIDYDWFDTDLENAAKVLEDAGITPYLYHNGGVFAQMVNKIGKFSFIFGTRYDYDSRHGGSSNPRFAALYSPNSKYSFRVSAGTAFKAPSIGVSNNSFRLNFAEDSLRLKNKTGNKFLQPETARTFEAGYRHQISKRSYLDIAIYNSSLENLIASEVTNQGLTAEDAAEIVSENVADAKSVLFGIQVLFTTRNIIPAIKLSNDINLNLAWGSEVLPDSTRLAAYRGVPWFTGQFNISAQLFRSSYLRLDNLFMSGWYLNNVRNDEDLLNPDSMTKGYYTLDAVFNYAISPNLLFSFKVVNVFDKAYGTASITTGILDENTIPQLGRHFRIGLSYSLDR